MVVAESEYRRHRFGRATMKENKISKVHQVELYHNPPPVDSHLTNSSMPGAPSYQT